MSVNKPLECPFSVFSIFLIFFLLLKRNVLGGNQERFESKNCKRDNNLITFIYSLYISLALKIIIPRRVTDILQCSSAETGHAMAVLKFNGFSSAVFCILVIYQKKLFMPRMTL